MQINNGVLILVLMLCFEHLGTDNRRRKAMGRLQNEEKEKEVMMWDILNYTYNQNTMGFATGSNINRADYENHGFTERRNKTLWRKS